jgi:hypothetical protein
MAQFGADGVVSVHGGVLLRAQQDGKREPESSGYPPGRALAAMDLSGKSTVLRITRHHKIAGIELGPPLNIGHEKRTHHPRPAASAGSYPATYC